MSATTPISDQTDARPSVDGRSATTGDLVQRVRAGETAAWRELVDAYSGLIRAVARRHGLQDPDVADVAQTTWLRAFEHVGRLKQPDRLAAWLVTVARRESLRLLRGSRRCTPVDSDVLAEIPDTYSVDAALLTEERDAHLWRAVRALPQRQQRTLTLLVQEPQASYEAIGYELGMPVGSIGPTRARALSRLRRDPGLAAVAAAA